eukprot:CAMPEP_0170185742 /NCGR_PEP_ID=MMETSP0040_2-20121228/37372_1 /TAXON_ID=641309 /ORGANISM="Lotharella oceanica, Strain CCMP622" /LENGTH=150 /DNA_ID=CAMNT_0010432249 /DNA_START=57 /DNA_END=509 /DNA_ORIENTATION=+
MTAMGMGAVGTPLNIRNAKAVSGIAESRLQSSLTELQHMDGQIVAHRYREAREALREGNLSHLREDVREAMAYHPVSEADAKAAIESLVQLDNALRKAERGSGSSMVIFPVLADAVDSLEKVTRALLQDGSLYGEEFTNPGAFKKRFLPK